VKDFLFKTAGDDLQNVHVVSSIGAGWAKGAISTSSLEDVHTVINDLAVSHYVLAKSILVDWTKRLAGHSNTAKQSPSYTFITGAAAEGANTQTSLMNVGAATLVSIAAQFRAEFDKSPIRVNEYRIAIRVVKEPKQSWENDHQVIGDALTGVINGAYKSQTLRAGTLDDIKKHAASL
jgi:hypothetical protein